MSHIHFRRSFTVHHMPKRFRFLLAECSSAESQITIWINRQNDWWPICMKSMNLEHEHVPGDRSLWGEELRIRLLVRISTAPLPSPPLCFVLSTALPKIAKVKIDLMLCFQYRCMLSSTDLQREIKRTFRPWFIYDCVIWALRTLEMQMERLRNFVSRWEHREHFNLTVSQLLTPPDATRRSYREMVSSCIILHFIDIVLS